jgi:glycosyltransferase involved in cell wall biosynthesis
LISVITPAFNEAENLRALYERLASAMATVGVEWEWIVVDDHSRDDTFAVVHALAAVDPRVRGFRLASNSGSHVAITCGLHQAAGAAAIMLAADLQDPPETIARLSAAIQAALATPELKAIWSQNGMEAVPGSPQQFGVRLKADYDRYGRLIQKLGKVLSAAELRTRFATDAVVTVIVAVWLTRYLRREGASRAPEPATGDVAPSAPGDAAPPAPDVAAAASDAAGR